jgi:triacylglycerol lipase
MGGTIPYILTAIIFLLMISLDISRKINLTNKAFMSLILIFAPHVVLGSYFISNIQSYMSSKYLIVVYILLVIYLWIKVGILPYSKKQISDFRIQVLVGGRRLILYSLYSGITQIPFYMLINRYQKSPIPSGIFITDIILTVIFIAILYMNGIIRILVTSRQLSIIKKVLILIYMWIPIVNLFFIVYLGSITKAEFKREFDRIVNRNRLNPQMQHHISAFNDTRHRF